MGLTIYSARPGRHISTSAQSHGLTISPDYLRLALRYWRPGHSLRAAVLRDAFERGGLPEYFRALRSMHARYMERKDERRPKTDDE